MFLQKQSIVARLFSSLLLLLIVNICTAQDGKLSFTILQLNDVYEIAPLDGGKQGGMARVAMVRKDLLKKDPNVITVLAGDFVSPSLIGTLTYYDADDKKSQRVSGKHIIDVMNETGVDYVTFGNHEFDIKLEQLQKRINESKFTWVNSNVTLANNAPFVKTSNGKTENIEAYSIKTLSFAGGKTLLVGFIGVTLPFNKAQPVNYLDVNASVKAAYQNMKGKCDVIIALTHLNIEEDMDLAAQVPGLHMILGGHEHVAFNTKVGNVPIYKADANAKSVYVHSISYDPVLKKVSSSSVLKLIDESVAYDPTVNKLVDKWKNFADSSMNAMGYKPYDSLMYAAVPLDGRESEVRNYATNYSKLIAQALFFCDTTVDLALYNSGSLRVDDQLKGTVTQYDVLRSLPFGGGLVVMNLKGPVLEQLLTTGRVKNKNTGGYLQLANASWVTSSDLKTGNWFIGNKLLDSNRTYKILLPEFVAQGNESNLEFLKKYTFCKPSAFKNNDLVNDIRDVVIYYMKHNIN